ncbi:hypothetical protein CI109_103906 [Kwoniella shandongensis]|uniref:Uncharacterized protein n=1 Tax=Kwoniella shandongensis TaxID=1734106 RepID=A0A5M6BT70_9TREE|nr:uncharacterized protein CI109_005640 [Kwoniella shandongensis]KAA5526044.1 hypothetical protein CI109_005640 [Kwoniella shandongensis]
MASLLLGGFNTLPDGKDGEGKPKKKIPKVAVYVAGAAFAVTTGLTLLVLPFVKQAAKMQNPTQFMSHRNMAVLNSRSRLSEAATTTTDPSSPLAGPSRIASSAANDQLSRGSMPAPIVSPELLRDRNFNDREERSLYGATLSPNAEGDDHGPTSALLGFKALGIATAMVFGSAGLGALIVAKVMGVEDMSEFTSRMRENLQSSMPSLISSVHKPGRSTDGFDGQAIEQWVAKIEADDLLLEEEEARKPAMELESIPS